MEVPYGTVARSATATFKVTFRKNERLPFNGVQKKTTPSFCQKYLINSDKGKSEDMEPSRIVPPPFFS